MSDGRDRRRDEDAARGEAAQDDVEILGIEAVDEDEVDVGSFDLVGEPEADEEVAPTRIAKGKDVERLEEELAAARDRHLRLLADFDNFRKRTDRQREESTRLALTDSVRDLLPVVDNLERALAADGDAGDLRAGVEMIARQFLEVLRKYGVEPVPAVGEPFDPRIHEAVQRTESTQAERPTVVEEFQRGFRLQERLVRPALVRVAVPPETSATDDAGESGSRGLDVEGGSREGAE